MILQINKMKVFRIFFAKTLYLLLSYTPSLILVLFAMGALKYDPHCNPLPLSMRSLNLLCPFKVFIIKWMFSKMLDEVEKKMYF